MPSQRKLPDNVVASYTFAIDSNNNVHCAGSDNVVPAEAIVALLASMRCVTDAMIDELASKLNLTADVVRNRITDMIAEMKKREAETPGQYFKVEGGE